MSPEAQRIAIAEFCKLPPEVTWKLPSSFVVDNENRFLLPDFTNDLNACHEMEKTIFPGRIGTKQTGPLWHDFVLNLERVTDRSNDNNSNIHATAAQRCEAFLKTINLWKE